MERFNKYYEKKIDVFFFDKFGNKKEGEKKKGEIVDQIEKNVVEFDLMYLKEHQEQMGLVSLLHLNHLKQSKRRKGQLNYFQLLEKDYNNKIQLLDLQKKEEERLFTDKRKDILLYGMELKRDQAISKKIFEIFFLKNYFFSKNFSKKSNFFP